MFGGWLLLFTAQVLAIRHGRFAQHRRNGRLALVVLALMEPGLSRFMADPLEAMLGDGYWQYWMQTYIGVFVLMAGVGGYDLATRGRVHPAWAKALAWVLGCQMVAVWLYYEPWWAAATTRLVGH